MKISYNLPTKEKKGIALSFSHSLIGQLIVDISCRMNTCISDVEETKSILANISASHAHHLREAMTGKFLPTCATRLLQDTLAHRLPYHINIIMSFNYSATIINHRHNAKISFGCQTLVTVIRIFMQLTQPS